MRLFSKYALADLASAVLGCIGTASVMIGGGACVVGLGSEAVVQIGKALSSVQPIYKTMMFKGAVVSSAGLFFIGAAAIAIKIRDDEADKEISSHKANPIPCSTCKYYSGEEALPCAVRPLGFTKNCPDYAQKD